MLVSSAASVGVSDAEQELARVRRALLALAAMVACADPALRGSLAWPEPEATAALLESVAKSIRAPGDPPQTDTDPPDAGTRH